MGLQYRSLDATWSQQFKDHPVNKQTNENDPEAYFSYAFEYLISDTERLNSLLEIVSQTPQTVLRERYIIVAGLTDEEEGEVDDISTEGAEEDLETNPDYVLIDLKRLRKFRKKKLMIPRNPVLVGGELYGENLMWTVASSTVKEANIDDWWVAKDLVCDAEPGVYPPLSRAFA